ncbi:unnamed protein product, partial [Gordionus sp. m RMFG-2023]
KKLEIPINTLEVEGLEEPVRDNSPKTSTSYPNYLECRCLDESVRAKKKKLEIPINTLEVEGLEEPVRDNCLLLFKLRYVLTYKTSQDHLELFFSCLRSRGGFNNNPSAYQLRSAVRAVLIGKMDALTT